MSIVYIVLYTVYYSLIGTDRKRTSGRPVIRWEDDLKLTVGLERVARDREQWKMLEEQSWSWKSNGSDEPTTSLPSFGSFDCAAYGEKGPFRLCLLCFVEVCVNTARYFVKQATET